MIYGTPEFVENVLKIITDSKHRHESYSHCCDHAEDMSVHLYGKLPTKILNRVRPREDPAILQYRLDSWEPFTKSTADKALTIVAKMFNPTLYSIRWSAENEQTKILKDKTLVNYPNNNSVINYFSEVVLRKMMADPNAIICIEPKGIPETDIQRVDPIIKVYGSSNIWYKDDDHYLIFESKKTVKGVDIFEFEYVDSTMILEFTAYTPDGKNISITEEEAYMHNFGEIPAWPLKGNQEVLDNGDEIYKSFFEPAVPFWNKAINHESDLEGAFIQHMHPLRVEASVECDYIQDGQRCRSGYITNAENGNRIACPSCGGSGVRGMLNSPHGVIRVNVEQFKNETGQAAAIAPVSFVSVPTEATSMLSERVDKMLERGLYSLNMDVVNKIGENQSGRAKVIDRGELYDFLYKISSLVFETHLPNIFHYFNLYLFKVEASSVGRDLEKNLPEISKPTQFDISTAQELIDQYGSAKNAGASGDYLKIKQKQINAKEFSTDPDLRSRMDLIVEMDPLPNISVDDLIAEQQKGWITQMDLVIHSNVGNFVQRALIEDPKFYEKKPIDKRAVFETYASEIIQQNRDTLSSPNESQSPS